jgi:hypothetical protein
MITGWAGERRRGTRLHGRRSVSVSSLFPSQMQRGRSSAGGNSVRQLFRAGELIGGQPSLNTQEQGRSPQSTVGRPSSVAFKDGLPRRKAAQEGKAAKDTEDPLVKLDRVVELLDRGLLSVREYELLKQHILNGPAEHCAGVACNCTGPRQGWRAAS